MIPVIRNSRKSKTMTWSRSSDSLQPELGNIIEYKEAWENIFSTKKLLYLDYGGSVNLTAWNYQNSLNYSLQIHEFYCM